MKVGCMRLEWVVKDLNLQLEKLKMKEERESKS